MALVIFLSHIHVMLLGLQSISESIDLYVFCILTSETESRTFINFMPFDGIWAVDLPNFSNTVFYAFEYYLEVLVALGF